MERQGVIMSTHWTYQVRTIFEESDQRACNVYVAAFGHDEFLTAKGMFENVRDTRICYYACLICPELDETLMEWNSADDDEA
jgi:hypothetical protein